MIGGMVNPTYRGPLLNRGIDQNPLIGSANFPCFRGVFDKLYLHIEIQMKGMFPTGWVTLALLAY